MLVRYFGGVMVPALILGSILAIWLSYEITIYVLNPFVFKFFGTKPITSGLITEAKTCLKIDAHGEAFSDSWRTYVYRVRPTSSELYDTLFVSGHFRGDVSKIYMSEDANLRSYKILKTGVLLIFWTPKNSTIRPLIPYVHHYNYKIPSNFSDDVNFYILYPICKVGKYSFEMKCYRRLKSVWAIQIKSHGEVLDEQKALDMVAMTKEFDLPQPEQKEHEFNWSAYNEKLSNPILFVWVH